MANPHNGVRPEDGRRIFNQDRNQIGLDVGDDDAGIWGAFFVDTSRA